MPHFGTPDEAASPVVGGETRERADEVAKLVFVGGTGRSGTHVLSQLLSRHNRYGLVPVEVRFHTDPDGFPGLLAGEVTPEQFVKRLRGFWWKGFQTSALPRHVPLRRARALRRRGGAVRGRPRRPTSRPPAGGCSSTCSGSDRRGVQEDEENRAGRPWSSRAPTTSPPRRPWRGSSPRRASSTSSATGATPPPRGSRQTRGLVRPRTRSQGIEWWEERIRAIEARRRRDRRGPAADRRASTSSSACSARALALRPLFRFLGAPVTKRTRRYFSNRMTTEEANKERWREGISARKAEPASTALYLEALERLEADGAALRAAAAPLARAPRRRLDPLVYVYDRGPR